MSIAKWHTLRHQPLGNVGGHERWCIGSPLHYVGVEGGSSNHLAECHQATVDLIK